MDPEFTLHRSEESAESEPTERPSLEDWATLTNGTASPWLRARLGQELALDPDAAGLVRELMDPEYQQTIADSRKVLHPARIEVIRTEELQSGGKAKPKVRAKGSVVIASGRLEVVRFRANLTPLFLGISCILASVIWTVMVAQFLVVGAICGVLYAIDYEKTHPIGQYRKAVAAGDTALAEAILAWESEHRERRVASQ